ncbi:MAG: hypothetical protein J1E57_05600 [Prevotella sp.]|nr:hypothetical protein [Prevotella sp.]
MKKRFLNYCTMFFAVVLFGLSIIGCDFVNEHNEKEFMSKCLKEAKNAMDNGDYMGAYTIVDEMMTKPRPNGFAYNLRPAYDLNKKILTNEIYDLIGTDDNPSAIIILAIKERTRYNSWTTDDDYEKEERLKAEVEMLEFAIQVAQANGNDDLATKLQTTLDSWKKEYKESEEN